jgi:hypothetical protein
MNFFKRSQAYIHCLYCLLPIAIESKLTLKDAQKSMHVITIRMTTEERRIHGPETVIVEASDIHVKYKVRPAAE